MVFAKKLTLINLLDEKIIYEIGINNVKSISIFDNNETIRIDFNDGYNILHFKDYKEFEHVPDKNGSSQII